MRVILPALVALTAATLIVFAIWPAIDLDVARLFYGPAGFVGQSPLGRFGREFFRVTPFLLLFGFAGLYLLRQLGAPVPYAPSGRALVFLIASMAIGPGLIVNLGLKGHAHRPRPSHITEFGGLDEFRPWYRFDGACKKNCSFVSGEAAQGFWMVAPASLAPPPYRPLAIGAALLFGLGASALRLAYGGHFLSDALLGGLMTLIVVVLVHRVVWPRGRP
jgi:membrane-associated PAP2 superfamily phosphatase